MMTNRPTTKVLPTRRRQGNQSSKVRVFFGVPSVETANTICLPGSNSVRGFRTKLPAPMNPAPSLFRLIMSAIGRDVMRMALPASIMEPLSTLQV